MSDFASALAYAAALAEFRRWSTASDSRRGPDAFAWVCRLDDAGEFVETSTHGCERDAFASMTEQALHAALVAATAALANGRFEPT